MSGASAREHLAEGVAVLLPDAPEVLVDRLWRYVELLLHWRRAYNLTAITDPEAIVTHHLLDSLALWPLVAHEPRLLDVGSGAGLPAVPLALAAELLDAPLAEVVALDAVRKKVAFIQQCVIDLRLRRLTAVAARVESWRSPAPFPAITSRAFASLADFVAATRRHLAPQGQWYAMKGGAVAEELAALPEGIAVVTVTPLTVPFLAAERSVVVLREG
ncbi:16S rRNA (guanine(527)-N(7))-methyltransferase RsmG [Hydrogenophilus islandicus]